MEMLKRFIRDEGWVETVEYAIILGIIVVASIVLILTLGNWVQNRFEVVPAS